jgi:uncharacterized protein (TIGR02466 family)
MTQLDGVEETKKKMVEYMDVAENVERPEGNDGNCSIDKRILNQFPDLHDKIMKNVHTYVYDVLQIKKNDNYQFHITTSWINQNKPNDWGPTHYHRNALFSGCYYFNLPYNFDQTGNIRLIKGDHCPYGGTIEFDYEENNIYNLKQWDIVPQEDLLVIFPSLTRHSIDLNKSGHDRYSLAFNVWINGTVGTHISELELAHG